MARTDKVQKKGSCGRYELLGQCRSARLQKNFKERNENTVAGFYTYVNIPNLQKSQAKRNFFPLFRGEKWSKRDCGQPKREQSWTSGLQLPAALLPQLYTALWGAPELLFPADALRGVADLPGLCPAPTCSWILFHGVLFRQKVPDV